MGRWVVACGLLALAALGYFANYSSSDVMGLRSTRVIAADLERKADAVVKSQAGAWASIKLHGQIVTVSGVARTEEERDQLIRAIEKLVWQGGPVWGGIVHVRNRAQVEPEQRPYVWTATIIDTRRLRITGFAPSVAAQAEVLAIAQKQFPSGVEDLSRIAGGAPKKGNWASAIIYMLPQLERLAEGATLSFTDSNFLIQGITDNPALPTQIQNHVGAISPPYQGDARIELLGEGSLNLPITSEPVDLNQPFVWNARIETLTRKVELTGLSPSQEIKDTIAAVALREFPAGVDDRTQIVPIPQPAEWVAAATWTLRLLTKLNAGEANFQGNSLQLVGVAPTDFARENVRNGAETGLPPPYTGSTRLTVGSAAQPDAPPPSGGNSEPEAVIRSAAAKTCQADIDRVMAGQVIEFESASTQLQTTSHALLDQIAGIALKCPSLRLIVSGHTDNSGNAASNRQLSKGRATSVIAYLREKGVANGRMSSKGYGQERPIASNDTPEGKARNRRIEITVID
ncbi:MAG TPA: hypothetical protein DCL54_00150 [Alphaproteobacteria bacterium]|nr:hypothetical protein [Alphaproteobacteria bacterium]HAJ44976.1 hypothetical protein [Alphaproteobacteria bacterium]